MRTITAAMLVSAACVLATCTHPEPDPLDAPTPRVWSTPVPAATPWRKKKRVPLATPQPPPSGGYYR